MLEKNRELEACESQEEYDNKVEEKKRASLRRHHMRCTKHKVKYYHCDHGSNSYKKVNDKKTIGKLARTKTPCSCLACGRPKRKVEGVTRQEMKVYNIKEQLKEID